MTDATEVHTVVLVSGTDPEKAIAEIEKARELGRVPAWLAFVVVGSGVELTVISKPQTL